MQTTILRENLKEGLAIIERVVGRSISLPALQNVLLSVEKNSIKLSATDLQIGVTYQVVGTGKEDGQIAFPPKLLSSLVALLPEKQITLKTEERVLLVESGNYHASIKTFETEEFPIIPLPKGDEPFVELEAGVFCGGINQVVGMTGQSQAKPEISGVFFIFGKEEGKIVATDTFRLAEKKLTFQKPNQNEQSFILPQKAAREVVSIFGEKKGKMKVLFSSTQIVFDYIDEKAPSPHIQMVSRLIEGEYPNYEAVMPSKYKTKVVLSKSTFGEHIKAASIFSGKTSEVRLKVSSARKGVEMFAQNAEAGENKSFFEGEVTGEDVEAAFNWRFLSEGIAQIKGETIEFELSGEDGPAVLRSSDQEGYVYVIMPIKA